MARGPVGSAASSAIAVPVGSQSRGSVLTRAAQGIKKIFFTAADIAVPERLYQVLYQLQQNLLTALYPLAENPSLGAVYFPGITFVPGVPQTFRHGLGTGAPVSWSATAPR